MKDENRTRAQLLRENESLQREITERRQREEVLWENERLLAAFHQIGQTILSPLDLDQILDNMGRHIAEAGIFRSLMIALVDESTQSVEVVRNFFRFPDGSLTLDKGNVVGTRYSLEDENITPEVARTGEMKVVEEWDDRFDKRIDTHQSRKGQVSYFLPVKQGDRVVAVLATGSKLDEKEEKLRRIEVMRPLLDQFAIALDHARLYENIQREITERKQAEEALRESESKFKELAELLPETIFETDLGGKITYANRVAFEKFGYALDDIDRGVVIGQLIAPHDRERAGKSIAEILNGKVSGGHEYEARRKDDTTFPVMIYSSPIIEKGKPMGLRGIVVDITEFKQGEEEKARLEARIRQAEKMEAMGNLAGGVAHDLNNILSSVIGFPELILMDLPEGSPLRGLLQVIKDSGEKAAHVVQDLLTLARRGVSVGEVVNANDIISDLLRSPEYGRLKWNYPGVEVEIDLETDLLNILGSPVHLSKTAMNLVSNAIEAMPDGGKLTLSTENRYLDRPIRGYDDVEEGDYAVLSVADTGTGISPEDMEKIFEPFYTKKEMGRSGTGLGMTVVWGTVKDHNGYIDLQSTVGEGTTFTLYFPVTRREVSRDQPGLPVEKYMGKGESVFVVDDVEEQQQLAAAILTRLGYSVTTVSSGEEAVEYLQNSSVDLLVLDMIMDPGMDGLDTYRHILKQHPGQKAIIVSGFSETDRVEEMQRLGAGAYVRKPYLMEKLGIAVRTELDNDRVSKEK